MAQQQSIPKGTRDFGPAEMIRRNYIFSIITSVFRAHGFVPIETPAIENLSTLLGKYGDEGDKLLFRILNSGDFLNGVDASELISSNAIKLASVICEKGLRYDLTVPFARYVVMHRNEITLPFKRYQVQPVWRADRPQKGRYREFYQCDADIVGSDSLINEIELLQMIDEVFNKLKISVQIKVNNRKILSGIAEVIGQADKFTAITVALDKTEKIGVDKVVEELQANGLTSDAIMKLKPLLAINGSLLEKLNFLDAYLASSKIGLTGIKEVRYLFNTIDNAGVSCEVELDLTLARGLNYYTGAILEVKALDYQIGSISGGGRYDNLTGVFGMPGISGVGISFGAERIFDVMEHLNLFPPEILASTQLLFVNFGDNEQQYCLKEAQVFRQAGIATEVYPDQAKMKKQMAYADIRKIPFVAIIGDDEIRDNLITLKNMTTGEQLKINTDEAIEKIKRGW